MTEPAHMSTIPDPASAYWPEMIDNQEKNTVFLKPLVTSPKIEVGEFTYYNDADFKAELAKRAALTKGTDSQGQ